MTIPSDEHERTMAFAEIALGQIRALRQPASPRHFEIWYTYATGYNPSLNQMINETLSRNGTLRESAKQIRSEMKEDMEEFRDAFQLGREEWQAMRDQWLLDRDTLDAAQWAQRRLDWFAMRDSWIASQRDWAQARRR